MRSKVKCDLVGENSQDRTVNTASTPKLTDSKTAESAAVLAWL